MEKDEYDINNYTDQECFDILDLDNPTDRVLEMKILQFMDKYKEKSKRLYSFFDSMYDRFFLDDELESDVVEGFDNDDRIVAGNTNTNASSQVIGNATTTISTIETHNVDYVKDKLKLNPVERKTIFKMISIDSQFREDPNNTSATNFTMNLTESIDNVISMKLYSVQIPYTWYTINETFGSNFFFIKGNSPGINNGNHDVKVEIRSGTYTGDGVVSAINDRITFLKGIRTNPQLNNNSTYNSVADLSLGDTKVSYQLGATDSKIVMELDLKKKYNETDYQLYFPTWSSPDVSGSAKSLTIPSFLGYRQTNYYPYVAYSQKNILPLSGDFNSANISLYTVFQGSENPLDISNNYFTIYQYSGTDLSFNKTTSTIINQIQVALTLPNGTYSRNAIYDNIVSQIATNKYIDHTWSYFRRINNTIVDLSNSHFEIAIKLNRVEIPQTDNSKLAIVFPTENNIGGKHIWTGADSCFVFKNTDTIELNEIVSEKETLLTNYIIDLSAATIKIECTKPNFDVIENTRIATVPASTANGYLFTSYIDAVNSAMITMNNATIVPIYKPNGEFNINVASSTYNTNLSIFEDKARFIIDIAREFNQTTYIVDLSSCFLSKSPFLFDSSVNNLTDSSFSLVKQQFGVPASITVDNTNNKIVLISKKTGGPNGNGYGNQNSPNIELFFTEAVYSNFTSFITGINSDFARFEDSDGYPIMIASNISYSNLTLILELKISKIITEINYKVSFIDNSVYNSWNLYLFMDSSYNLANNMITTSTHAEVFGRTAVFNNTITLTPLNNKFGFKPYFDGVADAGGANDIIFTLPLGTDNIEVYTREGLITAIQTLFDANELAKGSKIKLITDGDLQYANIRMNINKTYYASDFKLVFYDSISFVYCNVGVAQNATWDSTLGWLLGFHSFTEYELGDFIQIAASDNYGKNVFNDDKYGYTNSYNLDTQKIAVRGDVPLNTNLYNYFLVVLDDFIQNHVNAGLITITSLENDIALPSYASRVSYQCDPATGIRTAVSATNKLSTELTSKQLYAMNQIIENKRTKSKSYAAGPYMKDVFALIPMKLTGMQFGQTYMEFGGTMQNQDRKYYGPVRIQKFSIKLINDKGQIVDLNGANFSICLICEILNTNTKN
jgi:hypothetical protein